MLKILNVIHFQAAPFLEKNSGRLLFIAVEWAMEFRLGA